MTVDPQVTEVMLNAIHRSEVRVTRRIEIYESDGSTLWEPARDLQLLVGGSVSIDGNRDERRSADFSFKAPPELPNLLRRNPDGFWYDKIIKAYRGFRYVDGGELHEPEFQVGEFLIDSISGKRTGGLVSVSTRDRTKQLMLSKLGNSTTFTAGQSLDTIVKAVAINGGVPAAKIALNSDGVTIGTSLSFERTTSRWEIIKKLCEDNNIEVFFDRRGFLVSRRYLDPLLSPASLTFTEEGARANLLEDVTEKASDTRIYNRVIVTGESQAAFQDGVIYQGMAENREPTSPTRVIAAGGYMDRDYFYTSSFFTSNDQCQAYADRLIKTVALEEFNMSFGVIMYPWMEVNEIGEFYEPGVETLSPNRYLLPSLTVPMEIAPMTGEGRRVTKVL